ncbi:hypothetical protein EJ04DRAFT_367524 [Polyplosphaeria fusca]|uniref:Uncharacterized protein n=1 Tax=Polyplosphaeria fusca TaxID=682080 RepID=A0A9P4QV82_9PLEO|nr:hypothetical protein EJ04DRAFT_367524 [Polyplosphaeria fusca]
MPARERIKPLLLMCHAAGRCASPRLCSVPSGLDRPCLWPRCATSTLGHDPGCHPGQHAAQLDRGRREAAGFVHGWGFWCAKRTAAVALAGRMSSAAVKSRSGWEGGTDTGG